MKRLYIVEGLPCSGKSTTARFVADVLRAQGRQVRYVDEGTGNHPADYEFHAYEAGRVIPLAHCSPNEQQRLLPMKIYDGLPWAVEAPLMLEKWRAFVQTAPADTVWVFNCCLLQNPMCETMMRFGMAEEESAAHIRRIAEMIAPLDPVVIYLHTDDAAHCIRRTAGERPGWLDAVVDYHVTGAYGRSIGAQGFEGYIACLQERQRREERILRQLPVRTIMLQNAHQRWPSALDGLRSLL